MWKQNRSLFKYFRVMGLVMLIVGIGLIVDGIGDYADQSHQKDWISIEATVTDVSSQVVRYPTKGRSRTYYTIVYEYEANGEIYTGSIGHLLSPRLVGDTITVKYDPEMPEENTTILSPNTRDLVTLLILGNGHRSGGLFSLGGWSCFAISCERSTLRSRRNRSRRQIQGLIQRPLQKDPGKAVGSPTCGLASCVRCRYPFR